MSYTPFNNRERARQLLVFDGLDFDTHISPMDLDGLIEYHDKKRVLIETKLQNTPVPTGERLALQRMIDDFGKAGKDALAIIADHKVFDPREDVHVRECIVRELYHSKERQWRKPKRMINVQEAMDAFLLF